jgi:hypothetical protein
MGNSKPVWDLCFRNPRDYGERVPYVDFLRDYQHPEIGINLFLRGIHGDSIAQVDLERVSTQCPPHFLAELREGRKSAGSRRGAWLDDRTIYSSRKRNYRPYDNPLTAHMLYKRLYLPVCPFANQACNYRLS